MLYKTHKLLDGFLRDNHVNVFGTLVGYNSYNEITIDNCIVVPVPSLGKRDYIITSERFFIRNRFIQTDIDNGIVIDKNSLLYKGYSFLKEGSFFSNVKKNKLLSYLIEYNHSLENNIESIISDFLIKDKLTVISIVRFEDLIPEYLNGVAKKAEVIPPVEYKSESIMSVINYFFSSSDDFALFGKYEYAAQEHKIVIMVNYL